MEDANENSHLNTQTFTTLGWQADRIVQRLKASPRLVGASETRVPSQVSLAPVSAQGWEPGAEFKERKTSA
jgi:hypothetical protein